MITGTIVNYYFHCKRQCWLFCNKLNLEDNSEDVRIGRVLHEIRNEKPPDAIDNIKVDKITSEYVIEIKKSDADLIAAGEQLKYYLYILKQKGIDRKGKLECIEKNKHDKKIHIIELEQTENVRIPEHPDGDFENIRTRNRRHPDTLPASLIVK